MLRPAELRSRQDTESGSESFHHRNIRSNKQTQTQGKEKVKEKEDPSKLTLSLKTHAQYTPKVQEKQPPFLEMQTKMAEKSPAWRSGKARNLVPRAFVPLDKGNEEGSGHDYESVTLSTAG